MSGKNLQYRAYGKINLYLDVLDRRGDGFTNIETIFQSVGVYDTLHFQLRDSGVQCSCNITSVPNDESNLAVRAASHLRREYAISAGVDITIDKTLPVAGGMAGGSCNAAAALVACNELWGLGLDEQTLERHALAIGSDVPFCLRGGTAAATGRGEVFHSLPPIAETWLVFIFPDIPISAGALYNHPRLERSLETPQGGITPAFSRVLDACREGNLGHVIFNRMETPAFLDHPVLVQVKEDLIEAGCVAAAMSGSGSTLFGVCVSREHAENLAQDGFGFRAMAAPTVPVGLERITEGTA
jgi:4-diphosphocytidyl-2-C-methyl-D-erythritol kinase